MGYFSGAKFYTNICPGCGRKESHLGTGSDTSDYCFSCESSSSSKESQISMMEEALVRAARRLGISKEEAAKILGK